MSFYGFTSQEEAEERYPRAVLEKGKKTTKESGVVRDDTKWPQEVSHTHTITTFEFSHGKVAYIGPCTAEPRCKNR